MRCHCCENEPSLDKRCFSFYPLVSPISLPRVSRKVNFSAAYCDEASARVTLSHTADDPALPPLYPTPSERFKCPTTWVQSFVDKVVNEDFQSDRPAAQKFSRFKIRNLGPVELRQRIPPQQLYLQSASFAAASHHTHARIWSKAAMFRTAVFRASDRLRRHTFGARLGGEYFPS